MRNALILALLALGGCGTDAPNASVGDAESGRLLLRQYPCGTCHRIPGVAAAEGRVGPPLEGFAQRMYIAGTLPNTPQNLVAFIRSPHLADPRTTMPDLGIGEIHARDMAAYLSKLE